MERMNSAMKNIAPPGWAIMLLLVLILAGGCKEKKTDGEAAPPEVEVVAVVQKDVPVYLDWVGTAAGLVNADIRAQVTGYLLKQEYQEGSLVKTDQLLFQIDPAPFQAILDQAKAKQAQAEAILEKTRLDVQRYGPLAEKNYISKQEYDNSVQANLAAQADVAGAKAAVDKAALDLKFTRIVAPIDGIAGIANIQIGNLVGPNQQTPLTTVSTVDPIKVYIALSEQKYLEAMQRMQKDNPQGEKAPGPELELVLADGSTYPHKGRIAFADRQVDVRTGTIQVACLFPNPGNFLRPGIFAKVHALLDVKKGALLVPQRAVTELQGSYQVAVVTNENTIKVENVKVGERTGPLWVIDSGLQPGDRVVVEGVQKVREGAKVTPKLQEAPTAVAAPEGATRNQPDEKKEGR